MKISIVTISFNQIDYLEDCIKSVRDQNHSNWELIVVDPGSTDGSRDLALRYSNLDSRISTVFESDNGPSHGLNKGFLRATGEVIGCLNSDDLYLDNTFSQVVRAFERLKDVGCIYSHGMILNNGVLRFQSSDKFNARRYFSRRGLVLQQSTFFRRELLLGKGIIFNEDNRTCWDGEFILDLISSGIKFKKVFGNWGVFRIHAGSITGSQRLKERTSEDHKKILAKAKLNGLELDWVDHSLLRVPVFSLFRRIRNRVLFFFWKMLTCLM